MREELQFHIRCRADDLIARGLRPEEALRRARIEFGAVERWKERCREARGAGFVDELARNLRDTWRSARRHPDFAIIAVLSLALGVGANLAVFGLLRQLLLSPLPVRNPQELHQVVLSTARQRFYTMPYPKFATLRDDFPLFTSLLGWGTLPVEIATSDRKEPARMALVTGTFFDGLGVRPELGRLITPEDDRPGGSVDVAVLSFSAWERLFGRDAAVLARTIHLHELSVHIIGITPRGFVGTEPADPVDVFVPVHAIQAARPRMLTGRGLMWMHVMGRLKPDVPLETAATILRDRWAAIDEPERKRRGDNMRPEYMVLEDGSHGHSSVRMEFSRPVIVLMGLVLMVFLIACANLASLLFVRASRRSGELALRIAVGAGRATIVRQWLTECFLLALVGGAAGLAGARWITSVLLQFVPEENRSSLQFRATPGLVVFAVLLSVVAACLFGAIPTLKASRVDPQDVLRAHAPAVSVRRGRAAQLILAAQLAASLILVAGAVLFARTLWNLDKESTGFERKTALYATMQFWKVHYPREKMTTVSRKVVEALQASPRFAHVALGPVLSGGAGAWAWVRVPGYIFPPGEDNVTYHYYVSPGYFQTVSIPMIAGRDFDEHDATPKPAHVIVSDRLARHYFGGRDPIGRQLIFAVGTVEIIGVVHDIIDVTPRTPPNELVYWPESLYSADTIVMRTAPNVDTDAALRELRAIVAAAANDVPLESGRIEDAIQKSMQRDRLVTLLSAALGVIGVFLASLGLFGAVAHWASGRVREIGIRMMLGATSWDVAWIVLHQGLIVTGLGVAVGVPLSIAAATLIRPLLFRIAPDDLFAHATAAVILTMAGLLAACWPAWRAARVNPLEALRYE